MHQCHAMMAGALGWCKLPILPQSKQIEASPPSLPPSFPLLAQAQFMHDKGYCHRDLKPENCMIQRANSQLKVGRHCFCATSQRRTHLLPHWACMGASCGLFAEQLGGELMCSMRVAAMAACSGLQGGFANSKQQGRPPANSWATLPLLHASPQQPFSTTWRLLPSQPLRSSLTLGCQSTWPAQRRWAWGPRTTSRQRCSR